MEPTKLTSDGNPVKHPAHYCAGGIEVIDILRAKLPFIGDGYEAYLLGNVLKYLLRYPHKGNPKRDLDKAKVYLDWLVDLYQTGDVLTLDEAVRHRAMQGTGLSVVVKKKP